MHKSVQPPPSKGSAPLRNTKVCPSNAWKRARIAVMASMAPARYAALNGMLSLLSPPPRPFAFERVTIHDSFACCMSIHGRRRLRCKCSRATSARAAQMQLTKRLEVRRFQELRNTPHHASSAKRSYCSNFATNLLTDRTFGAFESRLFTGLTLFVRFELSAVLKEELD